MEEDTQCTRYEESQSSFRVFLQETTERKVQGEVGSKAVKILGNPIALSSCLNERIWSRSL